MSFSSKAAHLSKMLTACGLPRTLTTTSRMNSVVTGDGVQQHQHRLQQRRQSHVTREEYRPDPSSGRIIRSSIPDVVISPLSFTEFMFERMLTANEDKAGVVCGMSGRAYSFGDIINYSERMASALTKRGFKKGDVFAVIAPNIPEFPIIYFGVTTTGGIITTANPLYTSEEIARQLNDCGAKFVMTVPHFGEMVSQAVANCPTVQEAFMAGDAMDGFTPLIELAMDDGSCVPNVRIDAAEDVLCLPYSSGTTGPPKGVMLTHQNVTTNTLQVSSPTLLGEITEDDAIVVLLPLFHIYAMVGIMCTGLFNRCRLITLPRFDPEMFLKAIREFKPTIVPLVPPIISFLAKTPLMKSSDFDSVRVVLCGAAPLSQSVTEAFLEKIYPHKVTFLEGYGMTESSPCTHISPLENAKIGTCGILLPNTEAKIVDLENGDAQGPMQPGELLIRGPQVMKGYYKNLAATNETVTPDGWLRTGDIAVYDEDEHFKIIDRLKELIKVKGFQVSPSELEDLLMKHPGVQDAAVIGIPDSRSGELPYAYIVKKNKNLKEDEVASFIEGQVAAHKALKGGVEFVESIPKTQTGKILHRELKQRYIQQTNNDTSS